MSSDLTFGEILESDNAVRWFINPEVELGKIRGIVHCVPVDAPPTMLKPLGLLLPGFFIAGTPPPVTRTLDPKIIHHQAMSKLKVVLNHVHTAEDLKHLTSGLNAIM